MKLYKKVELVAKNKIAGSYAAGCPVESTGGCKGFITPNWCKQCERSW